MGDRRVSNFYWLLPIIFNWLGGFTAWLIIKDRDRKKADKMLLAGLIIFGIELFGALGAIILYVYS